ncbi:MAG: hypothetical protein QOF53_2374, partial [Nocardioidaceae bacterium]|nr:hypothetical protein [Nocardioidaceae bacterium]
MRTGRLRQGPPRGWTYTRGVTQHAHEQSAADWQSTLRAKGYRLTPQRELVLRAVER